jgi:hypothetical protein
MAGGQVRRVTEPSRRGVAFGPGQTVVLAELEEQSDDVVDQAMSRLGGTVMRRSIEDVEAETHALRERLHGVAHKL